MMNGNATHYTKPFRTKVKAKTKEEAAEKVKNFALRKMTLVLVEEKLFATDDLAKLERQFEQMNIEMDKIFGGKNG